MYAIGVGSSANPHPHRTINAWRMVASVTFFAGAAAGLMIVITQDTAWYKLAFAALVLTAVALHRAIAAYERHHDEMETATMVISNIAASHLRARRHLEGEDPIRAWHELAKEVNQELRSMGK